MKKIDWFWLVVVFAIVGSYGMADAVKDTLAHHYSESVFSGMKSTFWDANLSWCNKWRDCKSGDERFLGSSSVFVFLTDGWHLMKFFMNRLWLLFPTFILTFLVDQSNKLIKYSLVKALVIYLVLALVQDSVFNLFYHFLLLK